MKSPAELKTALRRQWENRTLRESRLLGGANAWPLTVSIGRVSPRLIGADLDAVKRHIDAWRRVKIGEVIWEAVRYRAADADVDIPTGWRLGKPSEWLDACGDVAMRSEFETMATLVERIHPVFHSTLVRRRSLWRGKPPEEVIQAARLALALEPGCAAGKPLRALSIEGIDTKFFERHERLVAALLDVRFDDEVGAIGLESFLGAFAEGDHWLLVMDLDGSLLPFRSLRVRSSELRDTTLPGARVLIVENETCRHQLPVVPGTLAVLGSGLNLGWAEGLRRAGKAIAYWGDIDTWGLLCLARARELVGPLDALMMTAEVYRQFAERAVAEPVIAGADIPATLSEAERNLYALLLGESRGRLEQEFLPAEFIRQTLLRWAGNRPSDDGREASANRTDAS